MFRLSRARPNRPMTTSIISIRVYEHEGATSSYY